MLGKEPEIGTQMDKSWGPYATNLEASRFH